MWWGDIMDELSNIIMDNQGLIYEAMKYFRNYNNKEDLYQVGCIGFIKAYKNFKDDKGCKFSTYAFTYILGEMKKLVREDKGIKISNQISKLNLKIDTDKNHFISPADSKLLVMKLNKESSFDIKGIWPSFSPLVNKHMKFWYGIESIFGK